MEIKHNKKKSLWPDIIAVGLLGFLLLLFFNIDNFQGDDALIQVPSSWINVNTIFLSIVIEAVPFILLGVFVSAIIQVYIKDDTLQRFLPKNAFSALLPAALLGAIMPICECAIVPVVRRLIKKGMPLHCGVVFLVGAPILNPVVVASTIYAFGGIGRNPEIIYSRFALAFILAIIIGAVLYMIFKNTNQLRESVAESGHAHAHDHAEHRPISKLTKIKSTLNHASDEFFDMGKYLIIGAFIAALFQTFLDRQLLLSIGQNEWSSTFVMMVFAYILSLCSEADAFVAASFGSLFTTGSLVAFLVYGPMLDLKNTILLLAYFKVKFVLAFIVTVTATVFAAVMILQLFII